MHSELFMIINTIGVAAIAFAGAVKAIQEDKHVFSAQLPAGTWRRCYPG